MGKPSILGRTAAMLLLAVAMCAATLMSTSPASAEDPPGNNGVVKLDGKPFDDYVKNEPHVGCVFALDFWNYDLGDYYASIRFVVIPPTGENVTVKRGRTFIGGDEAGGGTDLDGSKTFNLSSVLQDFMAHDQQGYHIKVIVNAPGSIGDDRKIKVFWVEGCEDIYS